MITEQERIDLESEIREKIAQDIEAEAARTPVRNGFARRGSLLIAARIAREGK